LCSIATALVSGSPTFAAIAASDDASDINLNTLVEQCAGKPGRSLPLAASGGENLRVAVRALAEAAPAAAAMAAQAKSLSAHTSSSHKDRKTSTSSLSFPLQTTGLRACSSHGRPGGVAAVVPGHLRR
jgi:hypothetical protein